MKDISLYNVMNSLSMTINLISTVAKDHHETVTYLAYKISDNLNINKANKQKLIFSSLIHDIGILYIEEDVDHKLHSYEEDIKHAVLGYHLIEKNFPVDDIPKIIKFHHHRWNDLPDEKLYMLSNILNLADELSYQISKYEKNILYYKDEIVDELKKRKDRYHNEVWEAFINLSKIESFWLDAKLKDLKSINSKYIKDHRLDYLIDIDDFLMISKIFSYLIDFRNPFTATHSAVISRISTSLARNYNFTTDELKQTRIAGYLHDIGKLSLPLSILNKNDKLDEREWALMRGHTYRTYKVLESIEEFPKIKKWASYHHEKLDGSGYPFHLNESELDIGSKIMVVADIYTALTEDRPYRNAFKNKKIIKILNDNIKNNKIDQEITNIIINNLERYNEIRKKSQENAIKKYRDFKKNLTYIVSKRLKMEKEINNLFNENI